jgi:hypothetical protein
MNHRLLFLLVLFSISALCAIGVSAQSSAGILAPSRAIDWSKAGVVGGIPDASWTQCGSTIAAGASATTIQNAINNCAANHYVLLGAGTFNLTTGLTLKSNVVLRGAGANQTFLTFSASTACNGEGTDICFMLENTYTGSPWVQPGQSQAANWTAGYSQGATSITLTNVGSTGITNGQYLYLDQANDTTIGSAFFVCDPTSPACSLEGGAPGRTIGGVDYNQIQFVKVTAGCASACIGSGPFAVTITPGLYGINWSRHTTGAWWAVVPMTGAGIENLSLDHTNSDGTAGIMFQDAFNCWISGIRSLDGNRNHVWILESAHNTIQNSYFYGTKNGGVTSYGVESFTGGDNLIINNIFQAVTAPIMMGPSMGSVFAYNFSVNDLFSQTPAALQQMAFIGHDAGAEYSLFEGNEGDGFAGDPFHGTSGLNTMFRNLATGWEPGKTEDTIPIDMRSYNRYENIIGNILGQPGYSTTYQIQGGSGSAAAIYDLGAGDTEGSVTVSNDPLVASTMMRWGNYDTVNATVRWVSAEVPSGISPYGNAVPANQILPASFFLSSQPSWWPSGKAWPPIGPDVTTGNVGTCNGGTYAGAPATSSGQCTGGSLAAAWASHVTAIPAQDCFLSVMHGPPDGSGKALSFDASQCYASGGGTGLAAPTGVTATVH